MILDSGICHYLMTMLNTIEELKQAQAVQHAEAQRRSDEELVCIRSGLANKIVAGYRVYLNLIEQEERISNSIHELILNQRYDKSRTDDCQPDANRLQSHLALIQRNISIKMKEIVSMQAMFVELDKFIKIR